METLKSKEAALKSSGKNRLTEAVGDILKNQKESYLVVGEDLGIVLPDIVLAVDYRGTVPVTYMTELRNIQPYSQLRFLSMDDAKKFMLKHYRSSNYEIVKAKRHYDLIEISLDPDIKTYVNKLWLSTADSKSIRVAGLQGVDFYSEDIINKIKELFNMFGSTKTIFDLKCIDIYPTKRTGFNGIEIKDISQLEKEKNKIINVDHLTLIFESHLQTFNIELYIYIHNKNDKLDTIWSAEVSISEDNGAFSASGSAEGIAKRTSSIPNIATLLSIGDALYDSLDRNINYAENHYQETLKKMLGTKLNTIYKVYEGWDEFFLTSELPNDSKFGVRFGADYWEIKRRGGYGFSKPIFHIIRNSSSFTVTYPIMDGYSLSTLSDNVKGMVEKIKDTPISNLSEFLDKLSSYLLKESTHLSRDELDKNLNTWLYKLGNVLLDLMDAINSLEE